MFKFDIPLITTALFGYKVFCLYEFGNRVYEGYELINWGYRKLTYKEKINEGWTLI
jgi:hypothetical protein